MKKTLIFGISLCSIMLLGSCKSQESAYRQAFEKAKAQQSASTTDEATTVSVTTTPDSERCGCHAGYDNSLSGR